MLTSVLKQLTHVALRRLTGRSPAIACPVCCAGSTYLGKVDFNKSCEEQRGMRLPNSGTMISYRVCDRCGFCFAPEFRQWSAQDLKERVYNAEYALIDPDYVMVRPENCAKLFLSLFASVPDRITHLDYGGGSGLMSKLLRENGWQSSSYDPFVDGKEQAEKLSTYDVVTAFEVFEHAVDPLQLMASLAKLTHARSLIVFTTLLTDGHIARGKGLDWWYLAPRNGHVSLFSNHSLTLLLALHGFNVIHCNDSMHVAFREPPKWMQAGFGVARP